MEIRVASDADSRTIASLALDLLVELSGNHPNGYTLADLAQTAKVLLREEAIVALLTEKAGNAIGEVGTPELPTWDRTAAFYKRNGFIEGVPPTD